MPIEEDFPDKKYRHPQVAMKFFGITYGKCFPQPIADQWLFLNCNNVPENLPDFISAFELSESEYLNFEG